jgi:hypothetical protein
MRKPKIYYTSIKTGGKARVVLNCQEECLWKDDGYDPGKSCLACASLDYIAQKIVESFPNTAYTPVYCDAGRNPVLEIKSECSKRAFKKSLEYLMPYLRSSFCSH